MSACSRDSPEFNFAYDEDLFQKSWERSHCGGKKSKANQKQKVLEECSGDLKVNTTRYVGKSKDNTKNHRASGPTHSPQDTDHEGSTLVSSMGKESRKDKHHGRLKQKADCEDDSSNTLPSCVGPHVAFYKGSLRTSEGNIADLQAWKKDYKKLEENHAYIQWLFPNYFDSRFNDNSKALTCVEANAFREDLQIAKSYVKSYELFLDFLGLRLLDARTGLVSRVRGGGGRLRKALVQNIHNHQRLRRVLASLAVTGFQRYMVPLVAHLEWEILGRNERVNFARDVCSEQPVLGELAKPLSKSEEPFLDTLINYVNNVDEDFARVTKASPADCVESVFLLCKDKGRACKESSQNLGEIAVEDGMVS
jgi:hypothetical protein